MMTPPDHPQRPPTPDEQVIEALFAGLITENHVPHLLTPAEEMSLLCGTDLLLKVLYAFVREATAPVISPAILETPGRSVGHAATILQKTFEAFQQHFVTPWLSAAPPIDEQP